MPKWSLNNRRTWIRIGSIVVLCLLAPLAIELVFLADVIGVETAIVFLFVYMKSVLIALRERLLLSKLAFLNALNASVDHHLFSRKAYVVNAVSSGLALWITGSLVLAYAIWLPSLMMLYQYG